MNTGSNRQLAGEHGGKFIDASLGTVTGDFMEIKAVATTILGAVTCNITNFPSGVTVQAGDRISGVFTSVAVSSGQLVAYNRKYV